VVTQTPETQAAWQMFAETQLHSGPVGWQPEGGAVPSSTRQAVSPSWDFAIAEPQPQLQELLEQTARTQSESTAQLPASGMTQVLDEQAPQSARKSVAIRSSLGMSAVYSRSGVDRPFWIS
jgi:hypothetical protein